jgi:small subunit ribosomal protein S6
LEKIAAMNGEQSPEKRLYEGMFLFDSNLASKDWPGLERHVEELLTRNSGELVYAERWPDRKLAYEIKGCKKGTYYLTYFRAPAGSVPGLERDCQLSDRVLRLLVIQEEGLEQDLERRQKRTESDHAGAEPAESGSKPLEATATPAEVGESQND